MDWQTLLTIAGIILFVVFMMRGCGGMGGGCGMGGGMGSRGRPPDTKDNKPEAGSSPQARQQ